MWSQKTSIKDKEEKRCPIQAGFETVILDSSIFNVKGENIKKIYYDTQFEKTITLSGFHCCISADIVSK